MLQYEYAMHVYKSFQGKYFETEGVLWHFIINIITIIIIAIITSTSIPNWYSPLTLIYRRQSQYDNYYHYDCRYP